MSIPTPPSRTDSPVAKRPYGAGAARRSGTRRRGLRGWLGPGAGGLVALAVIGVWVAWIAARASDFEPEAPLPRAVPVQALMGSVATLPGGDDRRAVRLAAPVRGPAEERRPPPVSE